MYSNLVKLMIKNKIKADTIQKYRDLDDRIYQLDNYIYDYLKEDKIDDAEYYSKELEKILNDSTSKNIKPEINHEINKLFTLDEFLDYLIELEGIEYNKNAVKKEYEEKITSYDYNMIKLTKDDIYFKRIIIFKDGNKNNLLGCIIKVDERESYDKLLK